jgi:hypothetical protein
MGSLLNKGIIVNNLYVILILPLMIKSESILILIGIKENISYHASQFIIYAIPSLFFFAVWDSLKVINIFI